MPYIYFGLEYKTPTHDRNESFAIACSNSAPGNSSLNGSIWSYNVVKTVRIDGKSWDQQIIKGPRARNWTEGNGINFAVANETENNNASFYEIKFKCQLSHANGIDTNWSYSNQYVIQIFYGTNYGNVSNFHQPNYSTWTASTPKITLTMPADPSKPSSGITASDISTLITQIVLFSITGVIVGMVGFYIYQTKKHIKRV